jgi:hypothetical protein
MSNSQKIVLQRAPSPRPVAQAGARNSERRGADLGRSSEGDAYASRDALSPPSCKASPAKEEWNESAKGQETAEAYEMRLGDTLCSTRFESTAEGKPPLFCVAYSGTGEP